MSIPFWFFLSLLHSSSTRLGDSPFLLLLLLSSISTLHTPHASLLLFLLSRNVSLGGVGGSMDYFRFLRFSGFRLYGPRPSSSFTSHRPDEATKPTISPRCRLSFLALRPCSSTRVPMGMGEEGEVEGGAGGDAAVAAACCSRCNRIK